MTAGHQPSFFPDPLDRAFQEFHHANPHVYRALVNLARRWRASGKDKCSMKMLFEVLRWETGLSTADEDGFKLNNNYTSRYARLIMGNCPDLVDLFDTRLLVDERHPAIRATREGAAA